MDMLTANKKEKCVWIDFSSRLRKSSKNWMGCKFNNKNNYKNKKFYKNRY